MYAWDAKDRTVEKQYDHIMDMIEEYLNDVNNNDTKISVVSFSICDDTIELILLAGFDVIIKTNEEDSEILGYEISWENACEGRKGEIKYVNVDEKINRMKDSLSRLLMPFGMPPFDFSARPDDEEEYDPTQDDEGFAHYFGFNKQYDD